MKLKLRKILITLLSIIGILLSFKLTLVYINANFVPDAAPSFCAINETVDCDAVAQTKFSMFLGVPVSIWGMMFYMFVLFLNFAQRLGTNKFFDILNVFKNPNSYIFTLSTIAIVVSLLLSWVSTNVIHKICILCYMTYAVNFFLLIISKDNENALIHYKNSFKDFIEATSVPINSALIVSLAILAGVSLFNINKFGVFKPNEDILIRKEILSFKHNDYKISGNILGDKDALVVIHEYTDLQCPFCIVSNSMLHKLVSEYKNIRIIHHNFPLDKTCNHIMKHDGHKNSCTLARYSEGAKLQNKLWDFNSIIFENNKNLSMDKALELAKEVGIDVDKLKEDSKSPKVNRRLMNDLENGLKLGFNSTPTYKIQNNIYEGIMPYKELVEKVVKAGAVPR